MNQLRELAPQVLAALVRRYGDFAGAEDAVQDALLAAATTWAEQAAVAMIEGPAAGLALLADLDGALGGHHRLAAVRAHLHERAGDRDAAIEGYRAAASHTGNLREREYLLVQAARVASYGCRM